MNQELDQNLLPGILQEICELIGIAATLKLVGKYGGVGLYVPKKIHREHELAKLIGIESAEKLASKCGGDEIEIPRMLAASIDRRNVQIRNEYKMLSQRDLALKYRLTERQIRNIVTGGDGEEDQMGLF